MGVSAEGFGGVPVNAFLGLELLERSALSARIRLPVRPELLQEDGVVHGGILSALADTAAVYVLYPELAEGIGMTSVEFKVNFLHPARPGRGPLEARATLVKRGRSLGLCEVEVRQGEPLILKGLFTYLFIPRPA